MTWGEFFVHVWNTDIVSWDSLFALMVLFVARLVVFG